MTQMYGNLDETMNRCKVDRRVQEYIRRCVAFHTFPAAGLLIGTFMVDLALEKISAKPGEKLYAVSETPKCAPDPLQVLLGCTMGNHRLRIINTGRYAITINRFSEGTTADGIRVYVDKEKVKKYPILYRWYTNDPSYKGGVSGNELLEEILCAGRNILSSEPVKVKFTPKEKWNSAVCRKCGEMVPENTLENGVCLGCGSHAYYEKA
jgi:formylmethanofuran dehydrogenase subunit E